MKTIMSKNYQRGLGILEVLIAVAVLSIALLALGGLHTVIIKSSSQAKSRGVATSLAQDKLDDLRAYGESSDSTFNFDSICDNAGGVAGNTITDQVHGNVTFTRSWKIYGFNLGANTAPAYDGGANCPPDYAAGEEPPDFKMAAMDITWWDENQDPQTDTPQHSVFLTGIANTVSGAGVSALSSPCADCAPKFKLNPAYTSADQDIEHDLGDELKRVSQPVPDTNRQQESDTTSNTVTTFREEIYNNNHQLIGQTTFATVNCYCKQAAADSSDPGLEPTYLKDRTYIIGDANPLKPRGTLDTTPADGLNDQPAVCHICCKDHHDYSTDIDKIYDPFRPSPDFTGDNDHNHYLPGTNGSSVANTASGTKYAEACRMAWTNGRLRVLQDWRLENLLILPPDYFVNADSSENTTHITAYTTFVKAFVTKFIDEISNDYPNVAMPNRATILADSTVADALNAITSSYVLTNTDPKQLMVRGIYIDYMDRDLINTIRCTKNPTTTSLLNGGSHTTCGSGGYGITANGDYLSLIPFHDVNLSKLAQWVSSNPAKIRVTSDALLKGDIESGDFSRGEIEASATGTAGITARIVDSNTGLTVTESIDPQDRRETISSVLRNPLTTCLPVAYGATVNTSDCAGSSSTHITGLVNTSTSTGLSPNEVYITAENMGDTTKKCALTVMNNGFYDTNDSCAAALNGATGVRLYIWHYFLKNAKKNCVLASSSTYSFFDSVQDDTLNSGSSLDFVNVAKEHTVIEFTGLTAGDEVIFDFTINSDSNSTSVCTEPQA